MAAVKKANTLLIGTVQDICRAFYHSVNTLPYVIKVSGDELEKSINNAFEVFTSTKINFNKDNNCKLYCPHGNHHKPIPINKARNSLCKSYKVKDSCKRGEVCISASQEHGTCSNIVFGCGSISHALSRVSRQHWIATDAYA